MQDEKRVFFQEKDWKMVRCDRDPGMDSSSRKKETRKRGAINIKEGNSQSQGINNSGAVSAFAGG